MNKLEPSKNKIEELISIFNTKNYSETLDLIEYLLKDYPNSILVNNIAGVVQTELQNYTLAEKLFIKVVKLNSNFSDGYYNLANIYNILGVLGISSFLGNFNIPDVIENIDLFFMLFVTIMILGFMFALKRLGRTYGSIGLILYFGYIFYIYN